MIFRGGAKLDHWQQSGNVWLWRYRGSDRNYPGWHLTADPKGAASLIRLLDVFANSDQPAFRTVQLSRPTAAASRRRIIAMPTGQRPLNFASSWQSTRTNGNSRVLTAPQN